MQVSVGVQLSTTKPNLEPSSVFGNSRPQDRPPDDRLLHSPTSVSQQTVQPGKQSDVSFESPTLKSLDVTNSNEHLQKLYSIAVQQFAHNSISQPNTVPLSSQPITSFQYRMFLKLGQLPRPTRSANWWRNGIRYPNSLSVTSKIDGQQQKLENPLPQQKKQPQEQEQVMLSGPQEWTVSHKSGTNHERNRFFGRLFAGKANTKEESIQNEEIGDRPDRSLDIIDESPAFFFSRSAGSSKLGDFWSDGDWHPPVEEPYYRPRP